MRARLRSIAAIGICAFMLPLQANALRIEGLSPIGAQTASDVVPTVAGEKLMISLQDDSEIIISPWPAFLPQRFRPQTVTAGRKLLPAGPSDRISFIRSAEARPWLVVGKGTRRAEELIGEWRLQLSKDKWHLADGESTKALPDVDRRARPVAVETGQDRWCIYLLESKMTAPQTHAFAESEPQITWTALRMGKGAQRCPAGR